MAIQFLYLIIGLALLWSGAELLIRFSAALARSIGVSPMIIGLTVVSIGTSLPEFVVSLMAALQDTMGISIGNIIGSNIANMGLILGLGSIITSLEVQKSYLKKEIPLMISFTILFSIFSYTGYLIARWEGLILFMLLIFFLFYLSRASMIQMKDFREFQEVTQDKTHNLTPSKRILYLLLAIIGIALLIIGSRTTVDSGAAIAQAMGVSETVIGLTLIAFGTSLPELATTIVGIIHKETDIVVGNVVGSNIFNLLFIGGLVPVIRPIPIDAHLFYIEFPFLLAVSFLLWPIMRHRLNVYRWEGILLLLLYVVFIGTTFSW